MSFQIISLTAIVSLFCIFTSTCIDFNKNYTGVVFSPHVKFPLQNGTIPNYLYTENDCRTMLKLISTRFSRVVTYENFIHPQNVTKGPGSIKQLVAQIAAKLNFEAKRKILSIYFGIWWLDDRNREKQLKLAEKIVEKANKYYPETVTGFIISHNEPPGNKSHTEQVEKYLRRLKPLTQRLNLSVGTQQYCHDLLRENINSNFSEIQRRILHLSDFIVCEIQPLVHINEIVATASFELTKYNLLQYRQQLLKINSKLQVMAQVGWPSAGANIWDNVDNLRVQWADANTWAKEQNYPIWFFEAFDNPWRWMEWNNKSAHYGWWKLIDNFNTHQIDGYVEKIRGCCEEIPTTASSITIVLSVVGLITGTILLLSIAILIRRVKRLQQKLSKDDLRQFFKGLTEPTDFQEESSYIKNLAMKFPYDKSYDIPKGRLFIRKQSILGVGQFGRVYKAILQSETGAPLCVALKVPKYDCSRESLKGLLSEIKILTYLGKHPNVVSLCGAYTAELSKGIVYVATELCGLGSLHEFLRNHGSKMSLHDRLHGQVDVPLVEEELPSGIDNVPSVTIQQMIKWSHEIACGMEYLERMKVVHADLATRNVLLDTNKTAKVADFGLSRRIDNYCNYIKKGEEPLPWRWMAVESLRRYQFSTKSDVWSFGVVVWEIFSWGDEPYPGLMWTPNFVTFLLDGFRLERPNQTPLLMYKLMFNCWELEPTERPSFSTIKELLQDIVSVIGNNGDYVDSHFYTHVTPQYDILL